MQQNVEKSPADAGTLRGGRTLLALLLFGISFGYVEAAVVVYMRALYEPLHRQLHPGQSPAQLFPLITLEQLEAAGPEPKRWLLIELAREAATLVMLAAAGLAAARNFRQWLEGFMVAFGIWDVFYYVFLKLLLDWPGSLMEWDLLFLLPVPWTAPVLAPLIVALSMVGAGTLLLCREARGRPIRPLALQWITIVLGGVIIILAFCWDYRNVVHGGMPNFFNWRLFIIGESLGLGGFLLSVRTSVQNEH